MVARHAVALLLLCAGSYALGVATSLPAARLGDAVSWRCALPHVVAVLAACAVVAGAYLLWWGSGPLSAIFIRNTSTTAAGEESLPSEQSPPPSSDIRADRVSPVNEHTSGQRTAMIGKSQPPSVIKPEQSIPEAGSEHHRDSGEETLPPEPGQPDEPAPSMREPQESDLIAVWDAYRRKGDGHFNVEGLKSQLADHGFAAEVMTSSHVGASDYLLIVETASRKPHFFVLPSFAKSPRTVEAWFKDNSDGALTGRIRRVQAVAEGRWTNTGCDLIQKGTIT